MHKAQKFLLTLIILFLTLSFKVRCADYYWVGGTGNWSDFGTHWATATGGSVFHIQPPTPSDNVYFDANSFPTTGDTVFLDSTIINCATMDWSGAINNPVLQGVLIWNNSLTLYGSLILNPNMKWNLNGYLNFNSSQIGNTINTNGVVLSDSLSNTVIKFDGSGTWNLMNDITTNYITFYNGTFYSNNFTLNCHLACQLNTGYIYLGTSVVNGGLTGSSLVDADSATVYGSVNGDSMVVDKVFNSNYLNTYNCSFNYVECHNVSGRNNFFKNILFIDDSCHYSNSSCNGIYGLNNVFQKAVIPCSFFDIDYGNQTFDSLIFTNPGQIIQLHDDTITINDYLEINTTCNKPVSIIALYDTATILLANGTYNFENINLKNISKAGSAICTLDNSIDEGGNSGWLINPPSARTLYWVGGSGNWSDSTHWSTSSGGIGGVCIPNQYDSLFFDINSFPTTGDTVFANVDFMFCRYMDWSGATNAPVFKNSLQDVSLTIKGSFILNPNMIFDFNSDVHLVSSLPGNIINTYGINLNSYRWIEGGGDWDLQSNLNGGMMYFISGTFHSNNYTINTALSTIYYSSKDVNLYLGTSTVTGYTFGFFEGINIFVDGDSATFNVGNFGAPNGGDYQDITCGYFTANSCSFNNVTCSNISGSYNTFQTVTFDTSYYYCQLTGTGNIIHFATISTPRFYFGWMTSASCYFDTLMFTPAVQGQVIEMSTSSFISINNYLSLNGSCSGFTSLICNSGSATITKNGSPFSADYLFLQNIHHNGSATFTANNSIDAGGNSGWIINQPAPRNLYWIGGTGDWNDISHWSTTSGGAGGACVPNQFDDVYFDANSFSAAGDTVFAYFKDLSIHSMDWSGVANFPTFYNYGNSLNIWGSFILSPNMNSVFDAGVHFMSDASGNIINTNGQPLTSNNPWETTYFDGTGTWELAGDFSADYIYFNNGTFRTNNYSINAGSINPYSHEINPTIFLGTSAINAYEINFTGSNTILHSDSCTLITNMLKSLVGTVSYNNVICSGGIESDSCTFNYIECSGVNGNYNHYKNIQFTNSAGCGINGTNNIFHNVIMPGDVCGIYGYNTLDTLVFNNPGQQITFSGVTTINNYLQIQSSAAFPTVIGTYTGSVATISKPTDTVCTDFVYMQNINASGGAVFYAGDNSVDLGNNTGWNFSSCTPTVSNVWPGDVNYDLITDNFDLLYIGLAYGDTGFVRPAASLNYVAQPCTDWDYQFVNAANVKHADTDGNGVVDVNDTVAVSLNYGLTHPFKIPVPDSINSYGTDLYFQMPTGVLNLGDTVDVPILLGTANNQAYNVYGIAFTINYDAALVQQGTMSIDFDSSWVGSAGNSIHIQKDFPSDGKFEMGFSRIDQTDISGYGAIATLHFVVAINPGGQQLNLSFSNIKVISHFEIEIPVNPISDFGITGISNHDFSTPFYISPNPMTDRAKIIFDNSNHSIFTLQISDITGRLVQPEHVITGNEIWIERNKLTSGIYFVSICNEESKSVSTKKLVIE